MKHERELDPPIRVTGVDGQTRVERFRPFPLSRLMILDLQRGHWLPEQQGQRAQVGVTLGVQPVSLVEDLVPLFLAVLGVLHVSQVILAQGFVPVQIPEEGLWQAQCDRDEVVERVENLLVQRLQRVSGWYVDRGRGRRTSAKALTSSMLFLITSGWSRGKC